MDDLLQRFDAVLEMQRKSIDFYEKQIESFKLRPLAELEIVSQVQAPPEIESWTSQKVFEACGSPEKWAQVMSAVKEQYSS